MKRGYFISRQGFTLIEILVVVGIIMVLASLVMANAPGMVQRANQAKCSSNLRNVWVASLNYASDNAGQLPQNQAGINVFATSLRPYLNEENLLGSASLRGSALVCPSDKYPANQAYFIGPVATGYALSYAMNGYIGTSSTLYGVSPKIGGWQNASRLAVLMDYEMHYVASVGTWDSGTRIADLKKRHGGNMNVLFGDGHSEPVAVTNVSFDVPNMFWQGR